MYPCKNYRSIFFCSCSHPGCELQIKGWLSSKSDSGSSFLPSWDLAILEGLLINYIEWGRKRAWRRHDPLLKTLVLKLPTALPFTCSCQELVTCHNLVQRLPGRHYNSITVDEINNIGGQLTGFPHNGRKINLLEWLSGPHSPEPTLYFLYP